MSTINLEDIEKLKQELIEGLEKEFPKTFAVQSDYGYCEVEIISEKHFWLKKETLSTITQFVWKYNDLLELERLANLYFRHTE